MNEFMKVLLSLSVSGTLLILFILGLKLLYKNKFSRRWQYYIWIIAALRFLLPFAPDTSIVGSMFEAFSTTVIANESFARPNMPVIVNADDNEIKQTRESENIIAATVTHDPLDIYGYLFFVWSVLALVLFVRKITIYQEFIRYIRAGNIEVSDIKTLNLLSDCEEKLNIKTRVELYRNALIMSPVMIGFFRPAIILPAGELENKELSYIFIHELRHYKQRDIFYKWLIQIVICIHWFNPLVYLLEKEVNKACELSCDEIVISVLDEKTRREYGDTLIYFLKSENLYKNSLATVTMSEGAEQLKERLGEIMNFKKKTKTIWILTGVLTLCILLGAAFAGGYIAADTRGSTNKGLSEPGVNYISYDGAGENDKSQTTIEPEKNNEDRDVIWYCANNWGSDWKQVEKALMDEYAPWGIEKDGKSYYCDNELLYVLLDRHSDSSFYTYAVNPKGTVSIEIIRNAEGEITGVFYMTEEEVTELLRAAEGTPYNKECDSAEAAL